MLVAGRAWKRPDHALVADLAAGEQMAHTGRQVYGVARLLQRRASAALLEVEDDGVPAHKLGRPEITHDAW